MIGKELQARFTVRLAGMLLLLPAAGSPVWGQSGVPVEVVQLSTGQYAGFYAPQGKAKTTGIVLVHGAGGNFYNFPPLRLEKAGYAVLGVNTHFHDGSPDNIGEPLELESLEIAAGVSYLKSRTSVQKVVIVGHSMGAARVAFYQAQAQLPSDAPRRVQELKGAQLPPADAVIILSGMSSSIKRFLKGLDPCMANFGRNCAELDLLRQGPPFQDKQYLQRLRSVQQEMYSDIVGSVNRRLKELESDGDPLTQDEVFLLDRGAATTSDPDYIDPQLTGCGENGDKDEEDLPVFFGFDGNGKAVLREIKCRKAVAGRKPRDGTLEKYKAYIKSPRSTGVRSLRGFLKYRGPETNYDTVRYLGNVAVPLLILHGTWDGSVLAWSWFENVEAVRKGGVKDFETYWIPQATHYLTGPASNFPEERLANPPNQKAEEKTGAVVADWLKRKGF